MFDDRLRAFTTWLAELICRFQGRDFRLTDVSGGMVGKLLA